MRRFALALVAAALCAPLTARADEPPGTPEMREAETRFEEGLALYGKGSINEARVKLVQAYAVLGRTNILWNLAVAEFYSSRFLESVRHMRAFVRSPDADPADVATAKKQFLPQLEKQTGRIALTAPKSSLIAVDGDEMGPAPLAEPVDVVPGRHLILARTGSGDQTTSVTVNAGQTLYATIGAPEPTAAAARGSEPIPISNGGGEPASSSEKPSNTRTVASLALGGAAVIAAGLGTFFIISAGGHDDDAKDAQTKIGPDPRACTNNANPECSRLVEANDAHDQAQGLAGGMFIGAGVLAVAAVLTYVLWPNEKKAPASALGNRLQITF